ncbi:hypothetical protein Cgig2_015510 [Carnegiea gigantea]|uniref:Uncharacterized protein n=1 Tax=Carnegiea gigantea TaxID=171969 RepID=A0A9Q1QHN9_9CARY|nr:hypothetical protein Cgig2_015510 [Carnegiea gigantea]
MISGLKDENGDSQTRDEDISNIPITPKPYESANFTVSDLIDHDSACWQTNLVCQVFLDCDAKLILSLFTVETAYHMLISDTLANPPRSPTALFGVLFGAAKCLHAYAVLGGERQPLSFLVPWPLLDGSPFSPWAASFVAIWKKRTPMQFWIAHLCHIFGKVVTLTIPYGPHGSIRWLTVWITQGIHLMLAAS